MKKYNVNNERMQLCVKKETKTSRIFLMCGLLILLIFLYLMLRSYQIWKNPLPVVDKIYEENVTPHQETVLFSNSENRRLNLAIAGSYCITDEHPIFYIGFPKDNVFDVAFTLKDLDGRTLYQTNYVAPGTNVAIDGTSFLAKGQQQIECLISVYFPESGRLVSDCTTVVLNINYE